MSQHSKFTDGKVLRAKDQTLLLPDLVLLLRGLEGGAHSLDDLRSLDSLRRKVNETLASEASEFFTEYTDAVNGVELEVAEKNIVNGMAVMMLREIALRPVMTRAEYAQATAPDVLVSIADWSWANKKWKARDNLAGDPENTARTLRIADVLDSAIGYKNLPDKTIAIEGDDAQRDDGEAKLRAV